LNTMRHRNYFSGEALTWWLVGATFLVLGIVATVFEIMNHEHTRTAAAPYAFHMVPLPKATRAAAPSHPHQVKQLAVPRPQAKEAKAPVNPPQCIKGNLRLRFPSREKKNLYHRIRNSAF
jgi:hypothetical protein